MHTCPMAEHNLIKVRGARVNNLKDVSVDVPKHQLTVFTGLSGSGKGTPRTCANREPSPART